MILERCLELLENTREEREALDLRDLEAIRHLVPNTGNFAKVLDSYEEGVITAREAVVKIVDLLACQRDKDNIGGKRAETPSPEGYIEL